MVGTVVLGIFPKEHNRGDVYLYVLGCQRILRLEVDALESASIAAALLHGKNTLIKSSLNELRSAEVDALLKEASVQIQAGDFVDDELADNLANLLEHAQPPKIRSEYALFHTYLETLASLQSELHCVVLSGMGQVNASLVIQEGRRNERFSLNSPLGDALALALYADVPVGIVPALVQRALPLKAVLETVPEEVRSVMEAIMPTPEHEAALQKKMDLYNSVPLVTVTTGNIKPMALHSGNRRVEVSIRRVSKNQAPDGNAIRVGAERVFPDTLLSDEQKASRQRLEPLTSDEFLFDEDEEEDGTGKLAKALFEKDTEQGGSSPTRRQRRVASATSATIVTSATSADVSGDTTSAHSAEEESLKNLLQRLVPETKVRM